MNEGSRASAIDRFGGMGAAAFILAAVIASGSGLPVPVVLILGGTGVGLAIATGMRAAERARQAFGRLAASMGTTARASEEPDGTPWFLSRALPALAERNVRPLRVSAFTLASPPATVERLEGWSRKGTRPSAFRGLLLSVPARFPGAITLRERDLARRVRTAFAGASAPTGTALDERYDVASTDPATAGTVAAVLDRERVDRVFALAGRGAEDVQLSTTFDRLALFVEGTPPHLGTADGVRRLVEALASAAQGRA